MRILRNTLMVALALATSLEWCGAQSNSAPGNFSGYGKFISERNIFNPNRYARAANTPYRPRTRTNVRRNSFGLTGTMSYDEGETAGVHAFFDGTGADYRKVLQTGGSIAIFKVGGITGDAVTLVHETNTVVLKIGQQMREDSPGRWSLSAETVNFAKASSSDSRGSRRYGQSNNSAEPASEITDTNSMEMPADQMEDPGGEPPAIESNETAPEAAPAESPALPGGAGNDALRRLMELRAREEQQSGN